MLLLATFSNSCFHFQIGTLADLYLFEHPRIRKRSLAAAGPHQDALHSQPEVSAAGGKFESTCQEAIRITIGFLFQ